MKSILTEIVLLGEAIVFWAVALPAAVVIFPALALWEKMGTALVSTAGRARELHAKDLCALEAY